MTTYIRSEDFSEPISRWRDHEDERPAIEKALRNAGLGVDVLYLPLSQCYRLVVTIPDNVNVDGLEVEETDEPPQNVP